VGALWRSPARPAASLFSATDPWLDQVAHKAAETGQRVSFAPYNFALDDHGTANRGGFKGQEKRSAYVWFPAFGQARPAMRTISVTPKDVGEAPTAASLVSRAPSGLRCLQGTVLVPADDVKEGGPRPPSTTLTASNSPRCRRCSS
jgi:hypothetical protein